ncbi:MAG TPA: ParB/RepB/Spo0J family partition protein [Planctomycetota bacterium]|nr:ParB/RepB/Spo0J family partition protein [Planctomycetota bacterium]
MEKKLGRGLDRLFAGFAAENEPRQGRDEPAKKEDTVLEPKPMIAPAKPEQSAAPIQPISPPAIPQASRPAERFVPASPEPAIQPTALAGAVLMLSTDQLIANRFQPRKTFDKAALTDLMESIKTAGVLQPILVRKSGNYYEIVAGERRWRACLELKVASVPVIVKEVDDQKMLEWALIENTQRKDLNPIERARAYKELMTFFNLTQEDIAGRVGLDRATVANFIRLLDLPSEVQDELARESISTTHARGLLAISDPTLQIKLCQRIKREGMSVRRLEYIIRWLKRRKPGTTDGVTTGSPSTDPHVRDIEERLMTKFNTKVSVYTPDNKQGKIMISFYSLDDFQRILDKLDQVR